MKLIATKSMLYGGKDLQAGDAFEASERDGKLLKAIRKAREVDAADKPADEERGSKPTPAAPARQKYQTRRMKAKD